MELPGNPYTYSFEIETLLHQFVAMIDNAIVRRYNKDEKTLKRTFINEVKPRYIFGTKQRVIYFLTNKAKNYSLPAITISLKGIKGNKEKFESIYSKLPLRVGNKMYEIFRPLPIILSLKVSIITKYVTDLYQIYGAIASRFSREHNFISWYVPYKEEKFKIEELRSKVIWNGMDLSISEREKVQETDEDRFTGDLNFDIEGWLFPEARGKESITIKDIGSSIIVSDELSNRISDYRNNDLVVPLISSMMNENEEYRNPREYANIRPYILKFFLNEKIEYNKECTLLIDEKRLDLLNESKNGVLVLDGYNFENTNILLIPKNANGDTTIEFPNRYKSEEPNTAPPKELNYSKRKNNILNGIKFENNIINSNTILIDLKKAKETVNDEFDIAVYNDEDYSLLSTVVKTEFPFKV